MISLTYSGYTGCVGSGCRLDVFILSCCLSRRAVTEHQLLHDRGRTIQSLKRLIWLSSAIEGLHTAQARAVVVDDNDDIDDSNTPSRCCFIRPQQLTPATRDSSGHKGAIESLFNDIFRPHITAVLPVPEK